MENSPNSKPFPLVTWEVIAEDHQTDRCAVHGGWLVRSKVTGHMFEMVFVPDPKHQWGQTDKDDGGEG